MSWLKFSLKIQLYVSIIKFYLWHVIKFSSIISFGYFSWLFYDNVKPLQTFWEIIKKLPHKKGKSGNK